MYISATQATARTPHPAEHFSVENGNLVRMVNGSSRVIFEVSLCDVGHQMARGAVIVDATSKPIPARQIPIRRQTVKKILYDVPVIDPGSQYQHAFDPKAPPQHAMVNKA